MVKSNYVAPSRPYLYLPDGWNTGWLAAKAALGTTPAWITIFGDSILGGNSASDIVNTSIAGQLKAGLASLGVYGDYWSAWQHSARNSGASGTLPFVFSGSGAPSDTDNWARTRVTLWGSTNSGTLLTFTTPYACTSMEIHYFDSAFGTNPTFQYKVDGGAAQTVTLSGGTTGSAFAGAMKKVLISGLANTTHTLVILNNVGGTSTVAIEGVATYTGNNGIGFGRMAHNQAQQNYYLAQGAALYDRVLPYAGTTPQGAWYIAATTAPTAAIQALAGNIDIGTHFYATVISGVSGDTAIGPASSSTVITSAHQQVNLTTLQVGLASAVSSRKILRTKASGTGAAGSGTNPWFLLTTLNDNTTTTFTDNVADASLTSYTNTPFTTSWGAFGFPTAPHLLIAGMGWNDINNGLNVDTFGDQVTRLVQAVRRGRPNASILFFLPYIADGSSSDGAIAPVNPFTANRYLNKYVQLATAYNCGLVSFQAKWGNSPVTQGLMNTSDNHPNDAGAVDIANTICPILL